MIELFARTEFKLREPNVLTPIHIDDDISCLSGILLNRDYYNTLLKGRVVVNGLSVLILKNYGVTTEEVSDRFTTLFLYRRN